MKKQATTTGSERQLKFAEAGILFVLILGLALFVGAKVVSKSPGQETILAAAQESVAEAPETTEALAAVENEVVAGGLETKSPRIVTYALSEQTYFEGNFEEAADLFGVYAREHPDNAWGHYMRGLSCWKAGNPEAAEEAFVAALDIQPDHLKSLVNYGRVLLEMDRAAEARIQIEAALAINPLSVEANRVLGRTYHNLGLLDEAAASYRAALAIKIDDVWSLNNLGLVLIQQERFAEALPPLARAVQLNSNVACIQNNLGLALERSGYIKDSILAFERALAADVRYTKAQESLERIGAQAATEEVPLLDLELVAASFTAGPVLATDSTEALEPGSVPQEGAIEVASDDSQER